MSSNVNEDRNAITTETTETTERIAPAETAATTEPIAQPVQVAQSAQSQQPVQPQQSMRAAQPVPAAQSQPTPQQPVSPAQAQAVPQQFQQPQAVSQSAAGANGQPSGQPFMQQPPFQAVPGMPIASAKPAKKPNAWGLALRTIDKRVWAILAAGALVFGLAGGAVSAGLISAFRGDARSGYGVSRHMRMSGSFQGADGSSQGSQNGQSGQSGTSSNSLDSSARAF